MAAEVLHEPWYEAVAGRRVICPNRGRTIAAEECLACTALVTMVLDGADTFVRCSDLDPEAEDLPRLPAQFTNGPSPAEDEPDAALLAD